MRTLELNARCPSGFLALDFFLRDGCLEAASRAEELAVAALSLSDADDSLFLLRTLT
jgi:hypothetical protein